MNNQKITPEFLEGFEDARKIVEQLIHKAKDENILNDILIHNIQIHLEFMNYLYDDMLYYEDPEEKQNDKN